MIFSNHKISHPRWMKSCKDDKSKVRTYRIKGLTSNCRWYLDHSGRPWIDASIAELIVLLNEIVFYTNFCCSGLPEDHSSMNEVLGGYISFKNVKTRFRFRLPRGLRWDKGCIRSPVRGSIPQLRKAWIALKNLIVKHYCLVV